jgi:hypothetical protein
LFPATAGFVGVGVLSVVCPAAAALAFDRLVVGLLGPFARLGSLVFALSVVVETAIGQLTFFFGEALALWCVVAASRRRWYTASVLAVASSLASPLTGAFAGIAIVRWAPAWAAITVDPSLPSTHRAFYAPLVTWLTHEPGPAARAEVVPTLDHWEAAYVAATVPLARGWERQLDVADNPSSTRQER